jgi:glucokinase
LILAGDIGGTKTNLGLFDIQQNRLTKVSDKRYPSREHMGLEEIVADFLQVTVRTGNLPWIVDGATMAKQLGLERVRLLNDLEAAAFGISVMTPADLDSLHAGVSAPQAPRAVIAAGTGLGEAILFWDGTKHLPTATEGGHADFAPQTAQQADLWKYIKSRSEFVSAEMILSGRGFKTLHEFLDPTVRHPGFDDTSVDPAAEITRRALAKECPVCIAAMSLWIDIYGSEAGNLVVRTVARGGLYIAGGIALKILPLLKDGRFIKALQHKEKMTDFLAQVSVHVVLDEECPLKGAAYAVWKGL